MTRAAEIVCGSGRGWCCPSGGQSVWTLRPVWVKPTRVAKAPRRPWMKDCAGRSRPRWTTRGAFTRRFGEGSFLTATARIKDLAGLQATFDRLVALHPAGPKAAKTQDWAIGKSRFAGATSISCCARARPTLSRPRGASPIRTWCGQCHPSASKPTCCATRTGRRWPNRRPLPTRSARCNRRTCSFTRIRPRSSATRILCCNTSSTRGPPGITCSWMVPTRFRCPRPSTISKYMRPAASGPPRSTPRGVEVTIRQSLPGGQRGGDGSGSCYAR